MMRLDFTERFGKLNNEMAGEVGAGKRHFKTIALVVNKNFAR